MPLKRRQPGSQLPEVNLVPMMDVLMTVLTFFVIISMTMTGQMVLNVALPETEDAAPLDANNSADYFVVGLNREGEILIRNEVVTVQELGDRLREFRAQNPDAPAILKADRDLAYDQVAAVLQTLRDGGGDNVLLGVEP
jgi:biopolymer transport protein ExbD